MFMDLFISVHSARRTAIVATHSLCFSAGTESRFLLPCAHFSMKSVLNRPSTPKYARRSDGDAASSEKKGISNRELLKEIRSSFIKTQTTAKGDRLPSIHKEFKRLNIDSPRHSDGEDLERMYREIEEMIGLLNNSKFFQRRKISVSLVMRQESTNQSIDLNNVTSDDEEDEDDEDDEEGALDLRNISPNLAALLGELPPAYSPLKGKVSWQPPARSGLANSQPIARRGSIGWEAMRGKGGREEEGEEEEEREGEGREEEDEEEDEEEEDQDWTPPAGMSPSLLQALGLPPQGPPLVTNWTPPSRPGLSNSAPLARGLPILQAKGGDRGGGRGTDRPAEGKERERWEGGEGEGDEEGEDGENEEGDWEGYEQGEEEGYENEEEEEVFVPQGGMSLSLMKALGLDTTLAEGVETNWTPPQQPGLSNSSPIVKK